MKVRPKLFLISFAITLAALLLLNVFSYWLSTRDVESRLRADLYQDAEQIVRKITSTLSDREASLKTLAQNIALRDYLNSHPHKAELKITPTAKSLTERAETVPDTALPAELRETIAAFLIENRQHFNSVACVNQGSEPLFLAMINITGSRISDPPSVKLLTKDLPANDSGFNSIGANSHFIGARDGTPLRDLIERESLGPTLRYTIPVLGGENSVLGALVVDLKLSQIFKQAAEKIAARGTPGATPASRVLIVLYQGGRIYYHSNESLSFQSVNTALPGFQPVAQAMTGEGAGAMFYDTAGGDRWLASYRPLGQMDLSVAVAGNYRQALQPARRSLMLGLLISLPLAFATALALTLIAQRRSGSLTRLAQGAAAIARGELDQKLVVSSAENQPLVDSMNALTMRLREQLAREAESRQFESFMRLSAMLTHDLKNAIASLSLLVTNMERQFDNAEFRADAMSSLKEATEKLQRLVTKLSEPVMTMSGEHPRPRPINLVPIIRRVLASVATSAAPQSQNTEIDLPEELVAVADAERIEKVIENLVINALEAMAPGKGILKVAGASSGQGTISFSISDTGTGITRDFQERRLFHPFATTKHGGVGLGLYTCREVIRAHGGSIEVDSEPGVGTTFRVVLPSAKTGAQ